jgi:hypothetical protein
MRLEHRTDCAELPLIELMYASVRERLGACSLDILCAQSRLYVGASEARRALMGKRSTAHVAEAARRMTDVDLDTAWRAALRGDDATMLARVVPHVDPRKRKRARKGSPWRMSGWLSRRAQ